MFVSFLQQESFGSLSVLKNNSSQTELKNAILKIQDLYGPDWYNPVGGKIRIVTL